MLKILYFILFISDSVNYIKLGIDSMTEKPGSFVISPLGIKVAGPGRSCAETAPGHFLSRPEETTTTNTTYLFACVRQCFSTLFEVCCPHWTLIGQSLSVMLLADWSVHNNNCGLATGGAATVKRKQSKKVKKQKLKIKGLKKNVKTARRRGEPVM